MNIHETIMKANQCLWEIDKEFEERYKEKSWVRVQLDNWEKDEKWLQAKIKARE